MKKWPKEIILTGEPKFQIKSFYWWSFDQPKGSYWGYVIVAVVIFILLFPIWPYKLKVGAFYLSFYSLIAIVSRKKNFIF